MTEKVLLILIGGAVTFVVQRVLARFNEKRCRLRVFRLAFRGFPEYHRKLFFHGLSNEIWNTKIPPHLRDHCITFVFFLESAGRAVAKDVKITVHAKRGTGIVAHRFQVAKTAICSRLETKEVEDKELITTWKFINPGDDIELHVLVTGIDDPGDVEIGVDGEGIEVTERFLLNKSISAIVCAGDAPMSLSRQIAIEEPSYPTALAAGPLSNDTPSRPAR